MCRGGGRHGSGVLSVPGLRSLGGMFSRAAADDEYLSLYLRLPIDDG